MLNVRDVVTIALSRTWMVNVDVPAALGVPDTLPVDDNESPCGKEPETTLHV
jgi:hypothetical protein